MAILFAVSRRMIHSVPFSPRSPFPRSPIMRTLIAWTLTWTAIAGLVSQAPLAAFAQSPAVVTVDECRNLSDTDVRDRIRDLASTSLKIRADRHRLPGSRQHILGQSRRQRADRPRNRRRDRRCARGYELGRPGLFDRQLDRRPRATRQPSRTRPTIRKGSRTR